MRAKINYRLLAKVREAKDKDKDKLPPGVNDQL